MAVDLDFIERMLNYIRRSYPRASEINPNTVFAAHYQLKHYTEDELYAVAKQIPGICEHYPSTKHLVDCAQAVSRERRESERRQSSAADSAAAAEAAAARTVFDDRYAEIEREHRGGDTTPEEFVKNICKALYDSWDK